MTVIQPLMKPRAWRPVRGSTRHRERQALLRGLLREARRSPCSFPSGFLARESLLSLSGLYPADGLQDGHRTGSSKNISTGCPQPAAREVPAVPELMPLRKHWARLERADVGGAAASGVPAEACPPVMLSAPYVPPTGIMRLLVEVR